MERAVEFLLVIGNCSDVVEDEPGTDRGHGVRGFVNRGASGDLQWDVNGGRYRA